MPTSAQYGQPAQGSPVCEGGTVVGGTPGVVVVVDADVVVVVGDVVVVVGDVVVVVGDVVVVVDADVVVVVDADVVVVVDADVVVVVAAAHVGKVMVLSSRLTWPFRANTRPSTVVPVCAVAEVKAKMLPTKVELVPKVAELPTCQNTLQASAPPVSLTVLLEAVIRVDPAWKTNTALGLFCAFSVSVPVRPSPEVALYTPGARVCPPRSLDTVVAGIRPAASLYAVVRSDWACSATASAACCVPLITFPGGKPVIAVPGLTPRSPEMVEGPVLVTVVPANTAKDAAVPKPTGGCAAEAASIPTTPLKITVAPTTAAAKNQRRRRITDVTSFLRSAADKRTSASGDCGHY
jgi:hypothetical protein